jgi:hypothetical protein
MPPITRSSGVRNNISDQDVVPRTPGAINGENENSTQANREVSVGISADNEQINQNNLLNSEQAFSNQSTNSISVTENLNLPQVSLANSIAEMNSVEEIQVYMSKLQERLNSISNVRDDPEIRTLNNLEVRKNSDARDGEGIRIPDITARDEGEIGIPTNSRPPLISRSMRKKEKTKQLIKTLQQILNDSDVTVEDSELSQDVSEASETESTLEFPQIPSRKVSYNSELPQVPSRKVSYNSDLPRSRSRQSSYVEDLTYTVDLIFMGNGIRKYRGKAYTSSCMIVPFSISHPEIIFNYSYTDKAINKMTKLWVGPSRDKIENFKPPTAKECEKFLYEYFSIYNEIFSSVLSQTIKEHIMFSIADFKHLMRDDVYNAFQHAAIVKYDLSSVLQVGLIDLPFQIVLDYFWDTYSSKSTPTTKQDIQKLIQAIPIKLTRSDYLYNLIYYQQSIETIITKHNAENLYLVPNENNKSHRKQLIKWISDKIPLIIMDKLNARLDGELREQNYKVCRPKCMLV